MKPNAKWLAAAALSLALPALADHHEKKGPNMEAFVQKVTDQATRNPEVGEDLGRYMSDNQLDAETLVRKKIATPANVQQYRGKSATGQTEKGLGASGAEARTIIQGAATLVYEARGDAQDPAKKFVAESAGKIVTNLGKTYNEVAQKVQAKVASIQGKISQMVAIAIVVNGGGGGNGQAKDAGPLKEGLARREQGAVDPGEAEFGQAVMALTAPEIPLARYGKSLFDQAIRETQEIPELIAAQGAKLNAAQDELSKLVAKEESYRKGMKGMEGAQGTQEVLQGAISALGNHLVTVRSAADRLKAFEEGPGRAIEDVLECSLKTYAAGQALTQNIPDEQQLALGRAALDANIKAARGVGPMANDWASMLAWLGNEANDGMVGVPGYESAFAPEAGESKSGDAEKARKRMREAGSMERRKL